MLNDLDPATLVVYDPDGRIIQISNGLFREMQTTSVMMPHSSLIEYPYVEVTHDHHYVSAGSVHPRPSLPEFDKTAILADDIDTATIVGLPDPCTISLDGVEYLVNGGVFEISSPTPGSFEVIINQWPYYKKEWTINAS